MADDSNPFSVQFTRPDALPFVFSAGESTDSLIERLRKVGWNGQVVGPHGAGKSCFLATLIPALERTGVQVCTIELHNGQRRLPISLNAVHRERPFGIVAIDGYEQLSWWSRFGLKRFCRKNRIGLLVTSHADAGLPDLYRPEVHVDLAHRLVIRLLGADAKMISPSEVADRFEWHHGNLREVFMDLYDLYEARRGDSLSRCE